MKKAKTLEIFAGPNGSGKSTFARAYFRDKNGSSNFINADTIASGIAAGNSEHAAFHAGRVMLTAVMEAIKTDINFAFETTLSGKTWLPIIQKALARNYEVTIFFLYLEDPSLNIRRIRQRVKEGGHFIPKATVLRRYPRSFINFWTLYRLNCTNWFIFDNSKSKPVEVLSKHTFSALSDEQRKRAEKRLLTLGRAQ